MLRYVKRRHLALPSRREPSQQSPLPAVRRGRLKLYEQSRSNCVNSLGVSVDEKHAWYVID